MLRRYILAAAGATLAAPAIVSRGVLGQNLRKVKMGSAFTTTTNAAFLMPAICYLYIVYYGFSGSRVVRPG